MSAQNYPQRKPRLKTYGKSSRSTSYKLDEVASRSSLEKVRLGDRAHVKAKQSQGTILNPGATDVGNRPSIYDVPSSEEDERDDNTQQKSMGEALPSESMEQMKTSREGHIGVSPQNLTHEETLSKKPKSGPKTAASCGAGEARIPREEVRAFEDPKPSQAPRKRKRAVNRLQEMRTPESTRQFYLKPMAQMTVDAQSRNEESFSQPLPTQKTRRYSSVITSDPYTKLQRQSTQVYSINTPTLDTQELDYPKNDRTKLSTQQESSWGELLDDTIKSEDVDCIDTDYHDTSSEESPSVSSAIRLENFKRVDCSPPAMKKSISPRRIIDALSQDTIGADLEEDASDSNTLHDDATTKISQKPKEMPPLQSDHLRLQDGKFKPTVQAEESFDAIKSVENNTASFYNFTNPRVTYAQSRSHVYALGLSNDIPGSSSARDDLENDHFQKEYCTSLTPQNESGLQLPDQRDESIDDFGNTIKSVHELRAAGLNRRLVDEVHGFLEDIEDLSSSSRALRRMAIMDLTVKMAELEYREKFRENVIDRRFFKSLAAASRADLVFNFVASSALLLMLDKAAPRSCLEYLLSSNFLSNTATLLDHNEDIYSIAKSRQQNMSKVALRSMLDFKATIENTGILIEIVEPKYSPLNIALCLLDFAIQQIRRIGNTEDLVSAEVIARLVLLLDKKLPTIDLDSTLSRSQRHFVETILSILESSSLGGAAQVHWHIEQVHSLCHFCALYVDQGSQETNFIECLSLRLIINLTNDNPRLCEMFSTAELVSKLSKSIVHKLDDIRNEQSLRADVIDNLVLTLGALINLVESSNTARSYFLHGEKGMIDDLLNAFLKGEEETKQVTSFQESQVNVSYGYLAVLLGHLCSNNLVRQSLRGKLPDNSLAILIVAVEEFVSYQRVADRNSMVETEEWSKYTDGLHALIQGLRNWEGLKGNAPGGR